MEHDNNDNNNQRFMHDDSLWTKTSHIKTSFNDKYVKITKLNDVKEQELYYPRYIELSGNFEIELDIKSDHGEYITYILNDSPEYGGTTFGWRKIIEWTHLKIIRFHDKIDIFYNNTDKPIQSYINKMDKLLFIIRFNGYSNQNILLYKNLKITQNGQVIFKDPSQKDSFTYLEQKVDLLINKINYLEKVIDSQNRLFNILHYNLSPNTTKNSHDLYKEMLTFIDNVCEKYELKWWLIGELLLGAYKYGGFIPGDENCDIALIRKDYDKFMEVLPIELKENNLEKTIKMDRNFSVKNNLITFAKMNFWADDILLGFIDIFPYDFTGDSTNDNQRFIEVQKKAKESLKNNIDKNEVMQSVFKELNLTKDFNKFIITGIENNTSYFALFDSKKVFPLNKITLEDRKYPCPQDTKYYLSLVYGNDYMITIPVVLNQGFHNRLLKIDNINEIFERNIEKLRKVNMNFK